jgi:hypothetical protein
VELDGFVVGTVAIIASPGSLAVDVPATLALPA